MNYIMITIYYHHMHVNLMINIIKMMVLMLSLYHCTCNNNKCKCNFNYSSNIINSSPLGPLLISKPINHPNPAPQAFHVPNNVQKPPFTINSDPFNHFVDVIFYTPFNYKFPIIDPSTHHVMDAAYHHVYENEIDGDVQMLEISKNAAHGRSKRKGKSFFFV
eukprot:52445_1